MRKMWLVATMLVAVLSGCATMPSKDSVRMVNRVEDRLAAVKRVAVIADVCLHKQFLTEANRWSVDDSLQAGKLMVDAAKVHLTDKGYTVVHTGVPSVGSFLQMEAPQKITREGSEEVEDATPPFYAATQWNTQRYTESTQLLLAGTAAAIAQRVRDPQELCCRRDPQSLAAEVVGNRHEADALLVLTGNGTIVSGGKAAAQAIGTGLLTAVLTGGLVSVASFNVSAMDSYAALIDAKTGELLWSNRVRSEGGGMTEAAFYGPQRWPHTMLYHLPSRDGMRPAPLPQPQPDPWAQ